MKRINVSKFSANVGEIPIELENPIRLIHCCGGGREAASRNGKLPLALEDLVGTLSVSQSRSRIESHLSLNMKLPSLFKEAVQILSFLIIL